MKGNIISDCTLFSSSDAQIIIPYISSNKDKDYSKYGYYPQVAVRSTAKKSDYRMYGTTKKYVTPVHVPYTSQILDVGQYSVALSDRSSETVDMYSVILLIDNSQCYQIKNLVELGTYKIGDVLDTGQLLGYYWSNHYVVASYMDTIESHWPVRILDTQYYKQDPTSLLKGSLELVISARKYTQYEDISVESDTPHEIQEVFDDNLQDVPPKPSLPTTINWGS